MGNRSVNTYHWERKEVCICLEDRFDQSNPKDFQCPQYFDEFQQSAGIHERHAASKSRRILESLDFT
jgi:hypothetical protein